MSTVLSAVIEALSLSDSSAKTTNGHTNGHISSSSNGNGHSHDQHLEDVLAALSLPEKVFLLSGSSFTTTGGAPSHGLHKVAVSDALTDVRGSQIFNAPATAIFPNSTALSATFDVKLLQQIGVELANEMKLKSVECLLAPNLNLHRDPRAGRNQETFGEDPFLAGACGTAIVNGIQSQGLQACIKHLVCNDSETSRREYNVQVDERTLREIYLRPFEMAIANANPASIMTAYNKINGKSASLNSQLITDIVRNEFRYDGLMMSDWFGTYDGIASLKAGMDLEMPFPAFRGKRLLEAASSGEVSQEELDRAVLSVLRFLERSKAPAKRPAEKATDDNAERCKLLRQTAAESVVLLKNDSSKLPLSPRKGGKLAVIGALATDRTISHLSSPSYLVSPLEGIRSALEGSDWTISHAHGPPANVLMPLIDHRYTSKIDFHLWNRGQRSKGSSSKPVTTETHPEAKIAFLMRKVEGLDSDFEIEMSTKITVPRSGTYTLGVVSASDAEVFVDGKKVYTFTPAGPVDVQVFLFYQHTFEQTFTHYFEANRTYDLSCISQSQKQSGPEPLATGLFFGMMETWDMQERIRESVELAVAADETVILVGNTWEWEMEGIDRATLELPRGQRELLEAVIKAKDGDIVVVNQSGAAVDLSCAQGARAILHAHYSGQEAGNAIADILFGRVNPSGRSPYTWPASLEDCPSFGNFPHDQNLNILYEEGLHMGWRGFEKSGKKPLYAFGHGLSYTSFEVEEPRLIGSLSESSALRLEVTVRNTGSLPGKDVVQLYIQGPSGSSIERPLKTLEAFTKTSLLQPGASETVSLDIGRRTFSSWSTEQKMWEVEAGSYKILLASSSDNMKQTLNYQVESGFVWKGLL